MSLLRVVSPEEFGRVVLTSSLVPKSMRNSLRQYLLKAGILDEPYFFFGLVFYASVIFTGAMFLYFWPTIKVLEIYLVFIYVLVLTIGLILGFISLAIIAVYFYLELKIFNRTKKMEDVLPDFLQIVSANLKGGMGFEKALWSSIKPRFGILASEIALASKKVMTGHDVEAALTEFANKYDSPMLRRSMDLIIGELQSGGEVASIIDNVVANLKKVKELKDEMTASVVTYVIFIGFVVIFISPILFSLAFYLLKMITSVMNLLATSSSMVQTNSPGFLNDLSAIEFDAGAFKLFSHAALGIIAIFSSMIVSIIEKGSIKGGIKYVPIFFVSTQVFYYFAWFMIDKVFGSLITIR